MNDWIDIDITQPTEYTFSAWIYTNGPQAELFLAMRDESTTTGYTNFSQIQQPPTTLDTWVYITKTVTVQPNIKKLKLRLDNDGQLTSSTTGYTIWFDDVELRKTNFTSEIIAQDDYYAFGMKHKTIGNVINGGNHLAQKYKYNGKELQDELGLEWYDYQARNYDPQLGRWFNVDPLAEEMRRFSTYTYVYNNPLRFIDPDGMKGEDIVYFSTSGEEVKRIKSDTEFKTYVATGNAGHFVEAPMPNVITVRPSKRGDENVEAAKYQENDYQIAASTYLTNQELNSGYMVVGDKGGNIIGQSDLENVADISPTMVKAWSMQESHAGTNGSILQVNNNGDFTPDKEAIGITKGATFSTHEEINLAIRYAMGKGFSVTDVSYSNGGKTVNRTYQWNGWTNALKNYNGGGVENYDGSINRMIDESRPPESSDY